MPISTPTLRCRAPRRRGFTLVEVMVAALIGGFVLLGVLATNLQLMRSGVRMTQYAEMNSQVRRGLGQLSHDLKIATDVTLNSTSDLTLTIPLTAGGTTQVTYAWTDATQSLFVVPGASSTVTTGRVFLVRGIPALPGGGAGVTFSRFTRDGTAAATNGATKRIGITMNVARQSGTTAKVSDSAVSATFILRNKPIS